MTTSYVLFGKAKHHSLEILATSRNIHDLLEESAPFRAGEGWRSLFIMEVENSAGLGPAAVLYKVGITFTANTFQISPPLVEEAQ